MNDILDGTLEDLWHFILGVGLTINEYVVCEYGDVMGELQAARHGVGIPSV